MTDQFATHPMIDRAPGMAGTPRDFEPKISNVEPQPADPSHIIGHPANALTGINLGELVSRNDTVGEVGSVALAGAMLNPDIITQVPGVGKDTPEV